MIKKKKILLIILCAFIFILLIPLSHIVIQHYQTRDGLCVVGYHGVVSDEEKQEKYANNRYYLSASQFERQMKYLYEHDYQTLTMKDIEDYYDGKRDVPQKAIALTFDDGYKNFNTVVKPILEKYQFHGTCFVIGKHINDDKEAFLHADDIIATEYVEYYSHSYDLHRKAPGFDKKIIETLSLDEIDQDFQKNPVDSTYFAFPYGRSIQNIEPILEKNHVHLAFSYNQFRHMTPQDNRYFLPRYMIVDIVPDFYFQWIVE